MENMYSDVRVERVKSHLTNRYFLMSYVRVSLRSALIYLSKRSRHKTFYFLFMLQTQSGQLWNKKRKIEFCFSITETLH